MSNSHSLVSMGCAACSSLLLSPTCLAPGYPGTLFVVCLVPGKGVPLSLPHTQRHSAPAPHTLSGPEFTHPVLYLLRTKILCGYSKVYKALHLLI